MAGLFPIPLIRAQAFFVLGVPLTFVILTLSFLALILLGLIFLVFAVTRLIIHSLLSECGYSAIPEAAPRKQQHACQPGERLFYH